MLPDRDPFLERYGRAEEKSPALLQSIPDDYWTPWHIAEEALTDALKLADNVVKRTVMYRQSERRAKEELSSALADLEKLRARMDSAPVAIMDTRDALGICAPTESEFPALYALRGKRVRLVVEDELHALGDGAKQKTVR